MRTRDYAVAAAAACAVGLAVAGAAWALQLAGVPRPDPGAVDAAHALTWLSHDELVESTFTLGDHAPTKSSCRRVALHVHAGDSQPAARLELGGLVRTIPYGPSALGRVPARPGGLELARLQLAGCPPVLSGLIAGVVKYRTRTPLGQARVRGKPVLTLAVGTKTGRVTVYLDADTKRPVAVTLAGRRFSGRARLVLVPGGGRRA